MSASLVSGVTHNGDVRLHLNIGFRIMESYDRAHMDCQFSSVVTRRELYVVRKIYVRAKTVAALTLLTAATGSFSAVECIQPPKRCSFIFSIIFLIRSIWQRCRASGLRYVVPLCRPVPFFCAHVHLCVCESLGNSPQLVCQVPHYIGCGH